MNIAIIFGGGVGARFSRSGTPKQFVELYGKPIIAYTLEQFSTNPLIDEIVIPCVSGWEEYLERIIGQFHIGKRCHIVSGGATSHESRLNAMHFINDRFPDARVIILHDAVRPLVSQDNITNIVKGALAHGAAVSYVPMTETPAETTDFEKLSAVHKRSKHIIIKAPQAFSFAEAYEAHTNVEGLPEDILIDSCTLMAHHGKKIHLVESTHDNIKITTAKDYFIFKALIDERHYEVIFGMH
ncbi:2-C-methyl-D-erythritol 4-phosphate cytidylyltransferase [Shinella curvata]|uniref:2-C-methyl-D-erythritol 4-phosphate cytidylyltransferase n=1 Tax=Shinella curvata TaxID=1817964 RepID=A0ABT8XBP2_9HYPH|nr:IspD/TarI family cytidylyltransferase [Shinella curvata]MCJ8054127.1 2-C-methyl-D-erythritol 4-phosphate cytidylyltransferase [Shinella curvata]MDO6121149.1 2-C-methyl-D-erythritol 4-phosphate cytidylyltransferase [Shinella curvata]